MAFPSAEDVAVAIVAACRETGEDPIATAEGIYTQKRARHYALHALVRVFPKASRERLCVYVGCPGNPRQFWASSWNQIVKPQAHGHGHMAKWWDDTVYDRVIRAIEADRTRRAVAPLREEELAGLPAELIAELSPEAQKVQVVAPPPYRPPPGTVEAVLNGGKSPTREFRQAPGRLEPSGYRPPKGTVEAILDDLDDESPVFDRGGQFSSRRSAQPPASKGDLQRMLRDAAANTKPRTED